VSLSPTMLQLKQHTGLFILILESESLSYTEPSINPYEMRWA